MNSHGSKKRKGNRNVSGELRPPKMKMNDEDKTYIQRPVNENEKQIHHKLNIYGKNTF